MIKNNVKKERALKIITESPIALTMDELIEKYETTYKEGYYSLTYDFESDGKNVMRAEEAIRDYKERRGIEVQPFRPKWMTRLFYTDRKQVDAWVERNHPELRRKKL